MKLSDFKDDEAFEVVADLLVPISKITSGVEKTGKTVAEYAADILKAHPAELKEMFAILNRAKVDEYHCTAATLLADLLSLLTDPELMRLFGLQSETPAASGSALENTAAQSV